MRPLLITTAVALIVTILAASGCNYMRHPTDATSWGQPTGSLRLGIEPRGDVVNAFIENRGAVPQRIIARGITLTIVRQGGGGSGSNEPTTIIDYPVILLDREETFETLRRGEHIATPINISKLGPGTYTVTATYRDRPSPQPGNWWVGQLSAGPITVTVP